MIELLLREGLDTVSHQRFHTSDSAHVRKSSELSVASLLWFQVAKDDAANTSTFQSFESKQRRLRMGTNDGVPQVLAIRVRQCQGAEFPFPTPAPWDSIRSLTHSSASHAPPQH
jgi:hypothetical protein